MENKRLLLAILGKGIQRISPDGPWDLTEDIEVYDEKNAHLPIRVPQNDNHQNSLIGGGNLNRDAGSKLADMLKPEMIVCAYGYRSKYLMEINAPSESMVMSEKLNAILDPGGFLPLVEVFDEEAWKNVAEIPSNTRQEIHNIFTLAVKRGIQNVAIVTLWVHYARSVLFAYDHRDSVPAFKDIKLQFFVSESVLLEADPEGYSERLRALNGSQSFQRSLRLEQNGINAFLRGAYKSVQETVSK